MGKSNKLLKALVSGVKACKSPSKDKAERDKSSNKVDKDQRKGGKEKCLWSLSKSSSRSRDPLSAVAAFLDAPEVNSVQVDRLNGSSVLCSSGSHGPDHVDASKSMNNIHDSSVAGYTTLHCTKGFAQEELAAVRIQAAIRRYLATKRRIRAFQAVVRLQSIWRGQRVRKQAAAALRCIQALIKVQALARGHRVRSSELGQLIQKHIQQTRQQKKRPTEGWVSSTATLEQWQAKAQSKQDAVMKRQRALVYAFTEQLNRCNSKQVSSSFVDYQPDKSYWGWAWLERWMAANSAAKEQHSKLKMVKNNLNSDLDAEDFENNGITPKNAAVNNGNTRSAGENDGGVMEDTVGRSQAIEAGETHFAEKTPDQMKGGQEGLQYNMPLVNAAKGPTPSPSLSPPPPPPPPPRASAKFVMKPSASVSFQPPSLMNAASQLSQVCTKVVKRSVAPPPPPPPPPLPQIRGVKPVNVQERSSSFCQKVLSLQSTCPRSVKSPYLSLSESTNQLLEGATTSSKTICPVTSALPVIDSPSSPAVTFNVEEASNEPLSLPNVPDILHHPLFNDTNYISTAPSNEWRITEITQDHHDSGLNGTVSTAFVGLPSNLIPSAHSTMSFALVPEPLGLSPDQCVNYRTPLIIPDVTDDDMSDSAGESQSVGVKDDLMEIDVSKVDVAKNVGEDTFVGSHVEVIDQGEVDMDIDNPDPVNCPQPDPTFQSHTLAEQNGCSDLMGSAVEGKPMESFGDKQTATSTQGQVIESTSASLPNYMTTTKSAKAKVRSPTQKVVSPKQPDRPKPRFESTKVKTESPVQKGDSPKQKRDLSKQISESPRHKADSGVNRRHSLSTSESKASPGANKIGPGVWAKSKSQSASRRGNKIME